jgi:CRISPR-associated protein Cmr2
MKKLMIVSIGPVQDFIATARKSRDLWFGSWLLSELSKAAAKALVDRNYELVFPTPVQPGDLDPKSQFNAPNKVVSVVNAAPDVVGKAVEKAVRRRLTELRNGAFDAVGSRSQFKRALAERQVDDLLEFYWVGAELDGSDKGYVRARETAERMMSARKATRGFDSFPGKPLPKSSLDGVRESVIDESAYPAPGASDAEKEAKAKLIYDHFGARPAERLSGVDILKRLGLRGKVETAFPSTSHMAALPFLKRVDKTKKAGDARQLLDAIKLMLSESDVTIDETDGALVFSSRLAELIPDREKLDTVKDALEQLLEKYAGDMRPNPYFALLLADGDNMGTAIDNQESRSAHQKLSQTLSQFAHEVDGIVERYEGKLIYSGGDDVLAYLPLHTVLDCTQKLAKVFADKMSDFKTAEGKTPTLSSGIIVAHHLEPLADTLDLARQAERAAKSVDGKQALAITVSKRSGVDRTIKGKRTEVMERLETMICWRRSKVISAGTPYELQKLHQVLGGASGLKDAMIKEALRIVERKRESGGEKLDKRKQEIILAAFEKWLKTENVPLVEIAHEMIIASEFASAMDMVGVEEKECFSS